MRVALNGCGRVGRALLQALQERSPARIELVAVNDRVDPGALRADVLRDLMRRGSASRERVRLPETWLTGADPVDLPWRELDVDVVVEATGRFSRAAQAAGHLRAGARRVLVTAWSPGADRIVIRGANADVALAPEARVVSAASCTANAVGPLARLISDTWGWRSGFFTTVHPATADQSPVDTVHPRRRRGRSLFSGTIPSHTSAVPALVAALPWLRGALDGLAYRVPTPHAALLDLVVQTEQRVTDSDARAVLQAACAGPLAGVVACDETEGVGEDYCGSRHSAVVDLPLTRVVGERLLHITAWYDNEMGYAHRLVDLLEGLAATAPSGAPGRRPSRRRRAGPARL